MSVDGEPSSNKLLEAMKDYFVNQHTHVALSCFKDVHMFKLTPNVTMVDMDTATLVLTT